MARRPVVRSLSWPVGWLVDQLAGGAVDHLCILPAGADPAGWRPDGALVAELGTVDLIVANGAGYEGWVETASLPTARLIDTSRGLQLIEHASTTHSHGAGEHSHGALDPHTFLDPTLFGRQATRVAAALKSVLADDAAIDARLTGLIASLEALGGEWDAALAPRSEEPAHIDWSYLLARAGAEASGVGAPPLDGATIRGIEFPQPGGYDYLAQARLAIAAVTTDD